MKKLLALILTCVMLVSLTACGGKKEEAPAASGKTEAAEPITLKFNHTDTAETSYHAAFLRFADAIEEKTGGTVKMQVYANGELAGERDSLEMMQLGTLDAGGVSSAPAGNFIKEMGILDAPFLYKTDAQAYNASNGTLKEYLAKKSEEQNLHLLGFFCIGYRNMISKDPINSVEDLAGVKVRLMENDLHVATFEALDSLATTMAYSEVYTALQQGTIDAAENTNQNLYTQKYFEVCPYVALTGHFYCMKPVFISKVVYDKLTPEQQTAIQEAFDSILLDQWKETVEINESYVAKLEEEGCKITSFDLTTFSERCSAVYSDDRFAASMPAELLEIVNNTSTEW